jgi:hypothetical protein
MVSNYRIIDEPKTKIANQLIVNPIAILLASIFVPLFVNIPLYGKFWLPFVWLIINSYLLGSPTFWRECFFSIIGLLFILCAFVGFGYGIKTEIISSPNRWSAYFRILVTAFYFVAIYIVVFTQLIPFSIYDYVKKQSHHE